MLIINKCPINPSCSLATITAVAVILIVTSIIGAALLLFFERVPQISHYSQETVLPRCLCFFVVFFSHTKKSVIISLHNHFQLPYKRQYFERIIIITKVPK